MSDEAPKNRRRDAGIQAIPADLYDGLRRYALYLRDRDASAVALGLKVVNRAQLTDDTLGAEQLDKEIDELKKKVRELHTLAHLQLDNAEFEKAAAEWAKELGK